jgi:hypothetical protein
MNLTWLTPASTVVVAACASVAIGADRLVFDAHADLGAAKCFNGASASVSGDAVLVTAPAPAGGARAVFALPESSWDLSANRYLEVDVENASDAPLRFTFWALSGGGYGGVSTFSTFDFSSLPATQPGAAPAKPPGFETLAARERRTFRIDLYAKYDGPDAVATAVDPRRIRWLSIAIGSKEATKCLIHGVRATGSGTPEALAATQRPFVVPDVEEGSPAPGKRVQQSLPHWSETRVRHVLGLPNNWDRSRRYPIIVEYTGNIFFDKFCYSTGLTDQGNMAWHLSRGQDYICLNLPYVGEDGTTEQINGWGDQQRTTDYCIDAIRYVCDEWQGDPNAVFYVGFSRGQIGANVIALRDDRIADVWLAFIGNDPGKPVKDGQKLWRSSEVGWNDRAKRMTDRAALLEKSRYGPWVHTDTEYGEDSPGTVATRKAMHDVLASAPGTCTVTGTVRDSSGQAVKGARVSTGTTHFAITDAQGQFELRGLIGASRELIVTAGETKSSTTVNGLTPGGRASVDITLSR